MLTNLLISHIELRTEDSIDIQAYRHERKIEKVVIPLGDELNNIKEKYLKVGFLLLFCIQCRDL